MVRGSDCQRGHIMKSLTSCSTKSLRSKDGISVVICFLWFEQEAACWETQWETHMEQSPKEDRRAFDHSSLHTVLFHANQLGTQLQS
eukprot:6461917-Amphidinium_carterae.1